MFLTAYGEERKTNVTPSGEEIEDTYGYVINKVGQKVLQVTGKTNVHEAIQQYAEETKIENILAMAANGDPKAFRPDGMYIDTTELPQNMIEARQMMHQLEETWNNLPKEIKDHYDNDVERFIGESGTEKWMVDMGLIKKGEEDEQKHGATLQSSSTDTPKEEQI